jgi:hypothetical protein
MSTWKYSSERMKVERSMIGSLRCSLNSLKEVNSNTTGTKTSLDKGKVSKRFDEMLEKVLNDINHHRFFGAPAAPHLG